MSSAGTTPKSESAGVAPTDVGAVLEHVGEAPVPGERAELGAGVGDDREASAAGRSRPRPLEMAARLDGGPRLGRSEVQGARRRAGVGDPLDGRGIGRVEHVEARATRRRLQGAGQHLGEEARTAHAHHEHVVDVVDEGVAPRGEGRELVEDLGHHRDPAQAVGELGGIVPPERVVALEEPAHGVPPDEVGADLGLSLGEAGHAATEAAASRATAPISSITASVWARPGNMTS